MFPRLSERDRAEIDLYNAVCKRTRILEKALHPERTELKLSETFYVRHSRVKTMHRSVEDSVSSWDTETRLKLLQEYPGLLAIIQHDYEHIEKLNRETVSRIRAVLPEAEASTTLLRPVQEDKP